MQELNMHIENEDGEKVEVQIDEPIDVSKKLVECNLSLFVARATPTGSTHPPDQFGRRYWGRRPSVIK